MSQNRQRLTDQEIFDVLFNDSVSEGELSDDSEDDRILQVIIIYLLEFRLCNM